MRKIFLLLPALLVALAAAGVQAQTRHDSAVFVVDVSGTVSGGAEVAEAAGIVKDMNSRFPSYVKSAGLMVFGNLHIPQQEWLYGVGNWDRGGLDAATGKISMGGGPTPIGAAIVSAGDELKKSQGKTALIIVSDGLNTGATDPVAKAKAVKDQYGANVCIFTIQLGNDPKGEALLASLVQAAGCGKASSASALTSADASQALVDYIFPPEIIAPPPPPPVVAPKDSDGDGVYDNADQCPGTPRGAKVDARGCWVLTDIKFDSNKADIKPEYVDELDSAIKVLEDNPDLKITIEGHTDSAGSDESNLELSNRRAQAVMDYMVGKGIDAGRLTAKGYGESKPIADNNTPQGMAQNRRIELKVVQ
ncbi:MAG TPA: OmpA family protein [bacterium]|nr:OmpA family protein [bacterium]